ncbi:hypothetical protein ACO2Q9_18780 [Variovorax sp. VNK109]|jgi:hypothetical protein|uniref:hypothetical protein n=1 Tax=Variovorax sp. VNK109 TaxID=3400919 RepID=UPI003BFB4B15
MPSEQGLSLRARGSRWSGVIVVVTRNLIYVLSVVATLCAIAASSMRGEEAAAVYGAVWTMLGGAFLCLLLMLAANYFSADSGKK